MTMRSLNAHIEGHRLLRQMRDEENWVLGMYIQSAVSVAVEHNLHGRKAKSKYIDQPFTAQLEEKKQQENLTEEQKEQQIEQFFKRLKIMQANFNIKKESEKNEKDKEKGENSRSTE